MSNLQEAVVEFLGFLGAAIGGALIGILFEINSHISDIGSQLFVIAIFLVLITIVFIWLIYIPRRMNRPRRQN